MVENHLIRAEMQQQITELSSPYGILVIPLLAESSPHPLVDSILVVDCPEDLQLQRLQTRDKLSLEQAVKIMQTQATRTQRLAIADDIIDNSSNDISLLKIAVYNGSSMGV